MSELGIEKKSENVMSPTKSNRNGNVTSQSLYIRGALSLTKRKILTLEWEKAKVQKELAECTFTPKIS